MHSGPILVGSGKNRKKYFLDSNGVVMKNIWFRTENGNYYLDPYDGHAITDGIYTVDGKKYYFDGKGIAQKGYVKVDGKNYFFDQSNANMLNDGWITAKDGKTKYYADSNGELYTGYRKIGNRNYYFSVKDCHMMRNGVVTGPNNKLYYVAEDGHVLKNGVVQGKNGKQYFAAVDGHLMRGGWARGMHVKSRIGYSWYYYLDKSGVIREKIQLQTTSWPNYKP